MTAETRLQGTAMWEMLSFLLEGLIFIFIGLQLPQVMHSLDSNVLIRLLGVSVAIVAAMIVSRILWIFPGAYLPRWIDGRLGRATPSYPPWRHLLFVGWAGIRGGDSLVIALALPYVGSHGAPLPGRDAIIFITFIVILITLVVQSLTLAPFIRLLGIVGGNEEATEERSARIASIRAGAEALEQLARTDGGGIETTVELRKMAVYKLRKLGGCASATPAHLRLRLAMITAERGP